MSVDQDARALARWEGEGGRALKPQTSENDPVCGSAVSEQSPHQHVHDGRTYFFCGERCKAQFAAHPSKYVDREPPKP